MKALAVILAPMVLMNAHAQRNAPTNTSPTMDNFREWVSYIRPGEEENAWREIPWRNEFMPAVNEAKALDRPILLWAMNGNPCGET